jgi:integral membrane protein
MKNTVKTFRHINTLEGYSYLLLLFVAMPLKYMLGFAIAVKIAGMLHGILFIALLILLGLASEKAQWGLKTNAVFFIASLIPFASFVTSKQIKNYE